MNQREKIANEINSCFNNVETVDDLNGHKIWEQAINEVTDYFISQIEQAEKRAATFVSRIDICGLCSYEDFGYCGRRKEPIDLKYEHNEIGDLCKCSGFVCCKEYVERRFKIKEANTPQESGGK